MGGGTKPDISVSKELGYNMEFDISDPGSFRCLLSIKNA
jgi:hypothetical protein